MKVNQIISEMTAGSVASVAMPLGKTQRRTNETSVEGLKPADKVMTGKAKKKGRYANSILESKLKKDKVEEAKLDEDDLILVPGQGMKRKTGFVPHGQSRVDHEVEMARSDILATIKNAKSIYLMLKSKTEDDGLEGWVQEKLIKANDYLNSVKEYYDEKMMHEMSGGVIAGGGVGEDIDEGKWTVNARTGAKLDPRTGAELPPKEKPLAMKDFQPKQPKLTLDDVWRKVEYVVGQIFPDGDPIDWLLPWFRKQGIADHKIGGILERAAVKNGYKDLYDYYDSMKDQYSRDNVAEGLAKQFEIIYREQNGDRKRKIVSGTSKEAVARQFKKQYKLEIEQVKQLQQGVAEATNQSGYHTSVSKGKFLPSKFGQDENNLYLHDLMNVSGDGSGPQLVTIDDKRVATELAAMYGGYVERTSLDTYRIYQPRGKTQSAKMPDAERVAEGPKVDRMVKHIASSERESGKSKDEAENIAWATANKRGYLDNKNKKSHK